MSKNTETPHITCSVVVQRYILSIYRTATKKLFELYRIKFMFIKRINRIIWYFRLIHVNTLIYDRFHIYNFYHFRKKFIFSNMPSTINNKVGSTKCFLLKYYIIFSDNIVLLILTRNCNYFKTCSKLKTNFFLLIP